MRRERGRRGEGDGVLKAIVSVGVGVQHDPGPLPSALGCAAPYKDRCVSLIKHASRHAVVLRSDHSPPHPLSTTVRRWRGAQHEVAATQTVAHPPRPALLLPLLLAAAASPPCHLVPLLLPLTSGPSVLHRHHHAAHVPLHVHRHDVAGAVRVSLAAVVAGRVRTAEGVVAAQRVVQSTAAAARLGRVGLGHDVHRRPSQPRLLQQALTEAWCH